MLEKMKELNAQQYKDGGDLMVALRAIRDNVLVAIAAESVDPVGHYAALDRLDVAVEAYLAEVRKSH